MTDFLQILVYFWGEKDYIWLAESECQQDVFWSFWLYHYLKEN